MGEIVHLSAPDGHRFSAYRARPLGTARGGVVMLHEIFGVNTHIRTTADRLADSGFAVLVPALFDRIAPGSELDFGDAGRAQGIALRDALGWDAPLIDLQTARDVLAHDGKVAAWGLSFGGTLAWRAAAAVDLACAVAESPGGLRDFLDETPHCPVQVLIGSDDPALPPSLREETARRHPGAEILTFAAGHGFYCPFREDYDEAAAALAEARAIDFLSRHLD